MNTSAQQLQLAIICPRKRPQEPPLRAPAVDGAQGVPLASSWTRRRVRRDAARGSGHAGALPRRPHRPNQLLHTLLPLSPPYTRKILILRAATADKCWLRLSSRGRDPGSAGVFAPLRAHPVARVKRRPPNRPIAALSQALTAPAAGPGLSQTGPNKRVATAARRAYSPAAHREQPPATMAMFHIAAAGAGGGEHSPPAGPGREPPWGGKRIGEKAARRRPRAGRAKGQCTRAGWI